MKVKNQNSSSRRTEQKIKQAFAKLVQEKGSTDKITVSELAQAAEITRGTFYIHYDNIASVATSFREEILEEFFQDFKEVRNLQDIDDFFDKIAVYLANHEDLYRMLIYSKDTHRFMEHLNRKITHSLQHALYPQAKNSTDPNITFFVNGAISLIIKYFQENSEFSLEQINLYLKKMFRKIFLKSTNQP